MLVSWICWNSPWTSAEAIAAHMPPADAPENTSKQTSCIGTASPRSLAAYHSSSASIRKSRTPAVYDPADTAPAIFIPSLKLFMTSPSATVLATILVARALDGSRMSADCAEFLIQFKWQRGNYCVILFGFRNR